PYLLTQSKFNFEIFTKEVKQPTNYKNLTLLPIDNKTFTHSLIQCHGIITAGGFETPAEALYLKKKLLSIPILNHFEQECNAAALQKLGVTVIKKIDKNFNQVFTEWIQADNTIPFKLTHSTEEIVHLLMQQIPYNQVA
ncbi:MAG: glycosyl transferase, partial [Chitinophagaceae bacterium]|nr:glycosyl transferase [Chitinophagaceae bacterium]